MNLSGLGFWLMIALVVIAPIWAVVKKMQMKHELTLKLLEKGNDIDPALLAKLFAAHTAGVPVQKTGAELHRDQGGFAGFMFTMAGLVFALIGILHEDGISWPLVGFGAFTFLYGGWTWHVTHKEYLREKAEEKLSRD